MAKSNQTKKNPNPEQSILHLGQGKILKLAFILTGLAVIIVTTTLIARIIQGQTSPGSQVGVGADGFRAFVEDTNNLGVGAIASKDQVSAALGKDAKLVRPVEVSKVFNLNGNRGQTATFGFVRADGIEAFVYIDKRVYKDPRSLEVDKVYGSSLQYGTVNEKTVYVKRAQTVGGFREYHALVVKDNTVFRYVLAQPLRKISIKEARAIDMLKEIMIGSKF